MIKRFFFSLLFIVAMTIPSWATTYYVDSSITDTNPASATPDFTTYNPTTFSTSTGTDSVYKTIADVNLKSFSAGDSVLFRKGQTWREQLTVPSSGSAGSPITFGAFGSGEKPIIDGSDLGTSWTSEAVSGTDLTGDANLQAYYYLEEATNATRNDGTANVNHLTDGTSVAQSSTYMQGSYSAQFTAASSMVLNRADASLSTGFIGKTGSSNTEITVGVWVYLNSTATQGIISKGANPTSAVQIWFASGYFRFGETLDGSFRNVYSNADTYTSGVWYHIVGRINSTTKLMELFINGVKQTVTYTATSTTLNTNGSPYRIGYVLGVGYLDGLADENFIFNRALSDAEILGIYANGLDGTRNNFTGYYKTGFSEPKQVFENGSRLSHSLLKSGMSLGGWYWDSGNSRVYIRCTGDADPATKTIEIGQRNYGIFVNAKNYINIQNFNVKKVNNSGISFWDNSNNGTITDNNVSYTYEFGIHSGTSGGATVNNALDISYNTVSYSGGNGIALFQTTNSNIHHNSTFYNSQLVESYEQGWSAGIRSGTATSNNNNFYMNEVFSNGTGGVIPVSDINKGVGIWIDGHGSGAKVYQNRVYSNHSIGIFIEITSNASVYYNLIYNNNESTTSRGIYLHGRIGTTFENNIVYNNTIYGHPVGIQISGSSSGGVAITNNIIKNNIAINNTTRDFSAIYGGENVGDGSGNIYTYNHFDVESTNFIEWGIGVFKSTYANFDTAYGSATYSMTKDPLFMGAAYNDFRLQRSSPAINAGTDVGLHQDYVGHNVPQGLFPDIGAYEERIPVWHWRRWW